MVEVMKLRVVLFGKEYVALVNKRTKAIIYLQLGRVCELCGRKFTCAWKCQHNEYLSGKPCHCKNCVDGYGCDATYEDELKELFDKTEFVWSVS